MRTTTLCSDHTASHSRRQQYFQFSSSCSRRERYEEQKSSTPIIRIHRLLTEYADSRHIGFQLREHSSLMNYGHSALRQALHNFDLSFQFPGIATYLKIRSQEICTLPRHNTAYRGNSVPTLAPLIDPISKGQEVLYSFILGEMIDKSDSLTRNFGSKLSLYLA